MGSPLTITEFREQVLRRCTRQPVIAAEETMIDRGPGLVAGPSAQGVSHSWDDC